MTVDRATLCALLAVMLVFAGAAAPVPEVFERSELELQDPVTATPARGAAQPSRRLGQRPVAQTRRADRRADRPVAASLPASRRAVPSSTAVPLRC